MLHAGHLRAGGDDGHLHREVQLGERYDLDFHEHVGRADAPDLAPTTDHVHVSLPGAGRIVTVDLTRRRVVNRIQIDGMPTRMILLSRH